MKVTERVKAEELILNTMLDRMVDVVGKTAEKKVLDSARAFVVKLGQSVAESLLNNDAFVKSVGQIANSSPDIWCTSEQAAKLTGFSRPYMTALLDSEEFAGQVQISSGGHRRVKKDAVDNWMASRGVGVAKNPSTNLLLNSPDEFFDEPELSPKEEAEAMVRFEMESKESNKYRPTMRPR